MNAILVGPERDIEAALAAHGVETVRLDAPATGASLGEAGIDEADLLVLTDVTEATAIPIALEANPELRVVIYAEETMPEFVRGQVDLAVAPGVLEPAAVAEELIGADA